MDCPGEQRLQESRLKWSKGRCSVTRLLGSAMLPGSQFLGQLPKCPSIFMGSSGSYIGLNEMIGTSNLGSWIPIEYLKGDLNGVTNHVIWRVEPRWCFCQDFETEVDQQLSKGAKFYELPLSVWDDVQTVGLKSHYAPRLHGAMMTLMTLTESSGTI